MSWTSRDGGSVGEAPVTILVLDKRDLDGFPHGFHHRKEGAYRVASAAIAENVVIVVGTASPEAQERLLHAYEFAAGSAEG